MATNFKPHVVSPDAFIVFFPYKTEDTSKEAAFVESLLESSEVVVKSEILSLNTSKPKRGTGSWTVVLSSNKRYKSFLHPGCWCAIYISSSPLTGSEASEPTSGLKMVGIVRSIRQIEELTEDGYRVVRYQISGDDFQSVFDNTIYIYPQLWDSLGKNQDPSADAMLFSDGRLFVAQSPAEMMKGLLETLLGKIAPLSAIIGPAQIRVGGEFAVPTTLLNRITGSAADGKFVSLLNFALQTRSVGKVVNFQGFGQKTNIWSTLTTYSNEILNEIYTDVMPVSDNGTIRLVPSFVLRAIPFSSADGKNHESALSISGHSEKASSADIDKTTGLHLYVSKVIEESEIMRLNIGKSDHERFNFFFVSPNMSTDGIRGLNFNKLANLGKTPDGDAYHMADPNSLVRYGLRPYIVSNGVMEVALESTQISNFIVHDMWSRAHLFENGQVSIIGSSECIPVGTNINFQDRDWIAHVEQVEHAFRVAPSGLKTFVTNISFVRLMKKDGQTIDSVENQDSSMSWERGKSFSGGDT